MANNLRTRGEKSFAVFNYIFMTLLCIICIYPLWYVLVASLSDPVLLYMQRGILVWPLGEWSIRGYQLVMENPNIPLGFRNTLIYLGVGTFINMLITTMAAYGLSRKDCYWNGKIMKLIAFTMYFAGGLIPFYLMVKNMNLLDTYSGIILPVMVNTWNLIVMRTAFAGIPDSLEESARLDGANDWTILWRIFFPLAQATIAVIALFYAVGWWNNWFNPSIFLSSKSKYPLQLVLREILLKNDTSAMTQVGSIGQSQQEQYRMLVKYCTIIVATVPILIVYPFLQRYFVKGVMVGSIKG
ncbi:MAG: carbohydrate ABC transporter permease [Christensenellales bacterium]|mgnify:CR=1 FL=1|jgi:putative aldouronate transport system permease protein